MISCGIMVLEIGRNKLPDKSEYIGVMNMENIVTLYKAEFFFYCVFCKYIVILESIKIIVKTIKTPA